jgi:hypothetical protein
VDRRTVLSASGIARLINPAPNWQTLRIMVRFAFLNMGTDLPLTPRFWLGMMSNPTANE